MDTCVIYNSVAGRHRASERMRRFKEAWAGKVVFRPTERRGHAVDLAREAALEGFATVAAAGGDGTAHEVATGLLNSRRTDVTFAVIPLGSANDYAHSVRHQFGAMSLREPGGNFLDVGLVRTPDGREFHFFESLGTGLSAQVTLESNATPWLQGRLLYGCAACRVLARMDGPTQFSISENGCAAETCPTQLVQAIPAPAAAGPDDGADGIVIFHAVDSIVRVGSGGGFGSLAGSPAAARGSQPPSYSPDVAGASNSCRAEPSRPRSSLNPSIPRAHNGRRFDPPAQIGGRLMRPVHASGQDRSSRGRVSITSPGRSPAVRLQWRGAARSPESGSWDWIGRIIAARSFAHSTT